MAMENTLGKSQTPRNLLQLTFKVCSPSQNSSKHCVGVFVIYSCDNKQDSPS